MKQITLSSSIKANYLAKMNLQDIRVEVWSEKTSLKNSFLQTLEYFHLQILRTTGILSSMPSQLIMLKQQISKQRLSLTTSKYYHQKGLLIFKIYTYPYYSLVRWHFDYIT